MSDTIRATAAPPPVGNYPHARRVGELLLLSGIGPRDPATNAVPGNVTGADGALLAHDIVAQTHAVLANVRAVLEASGARWEDLVDVTVYLTDMAGDFAGYNAVWAEYFPDPATAPCRTTLGISALPTPIAIELKCIAAAGREPASLARPAEDAGTVGGTSDGARAASSAPALDARGFAASDAPPSALRAPSPASGGRDVSQPATQDASQPATQQETPR